jgi:hypothetical protein
LRARQGSQDSLPLFLAKRAEMRYNAIAIGDEKEASELEGE